MNCYDPRSHKVVDAPTCRCPLFPVVYPTVRANEEAVGERWEELLAAGIATCDTPRSDPGFPWGVGALALVAWWMVLRR